MLGRFAWTAAAAGAAALMTVSPAAAITTNGEPDNGRHPYVGTLLTDPSSKEGAHSYCSGSMIAEKVFLTAAHCIDKQGQQVWVSFDEVIDDTIKTYTGTAHYDPAYPGDSHNPHDIAVVVLDTAPKVGMAELPEAGLLDRMKADRALKGGQFDVVGYGTAEAQNAPGGHVHPRPIPRREVAVSSYNALNDYWLRLSQNDATGDGGSCYGDSGGPIFLHGTDDIVSTTITGDTPCKATGVTYRLDTDSARDFLDDYVALP